MICLDSSCIIDFLKGKKEAVKVVEKYKEEIATTDINSFEVFFGIYSSKHVKEDEEKLASLFFETIETLSMKRDWSKKAAKLLGDLIKRGKTIEQNDCLIASIMIKNGCDTIITKNTKHFSVIPGIKTVKY